MTTPSLIKTLGAVTFGPCGEADHLLFRVNPDIPLRQALEQVSALLYCAKNWRWMPRWIKTASVMRGLRTICATWAKR